LKEGVAYPITIKYHEKKQNAALSLFWGSKKIQKQIIPASSFYQDKSKTVKVIKGTYSSMKTYLCYTQNNNKIYAISYEWPDETLVLNIPNPGKDATVHMLGLNKPLDWKYEDNKMLINISSVKYAELPSHDAWTFEINKN
jgi:hypothetical protein